MRIKHSPLLLAMLGLCLGVLACDQQDKRSGRDRPRPAKGPEIFLESRATDPIPGQPAHTPQIVDNRGLRTVSPASPQPAPLPAGPMAEEAAPLPKADQRIAIFHSSNVEGELDPCG